MSITRITICACDNCNTKLNADDCSKNVIKRIKPITKKRRGDIKDDIYNFETLNKEYKNYYYNYPKHILEFNNEFGLHPTQKPVELLEYLIKTYTNENDIVLDNCMGSGSTGIACMNTNRRFLGIEKDNYYFEVAMNRIEKRKKVN